MVFNVVGNPQQVRINLLQFGEGLKHYCSKNTQFSKVTKIGDGDAQNIFNSIINIVKVSDEKMNQLRTPEQTGNRVFFLEIVTNPVKYYFPEGSTVEIVRMSDLNNK